MRDEEFYDLQMPVKGCKDLYASLDEYIKEETLDGDNQYHSERYAVAPITVYGSIFNSIATEVLIQSLPKALASTCH